jgi:hypothetical protein
VDLLEVLLGLPGAVGILLGLGLLMAALHLLINWVLRPGRSLRDRLGAVLLIAGMALVPLATLGYVREAWHEVPAVRVVEGVFGVALLAVTVAFVIGAARHRPDDRIPGEPAYYISTGPDSSIPGPSFPLRARNQERLRAVLLVGLVAGSGVAYVAHALGLFRYSWA